MVAFALPANAQQNIDFCPLTETSLTKLDIGAAQKSAGSKELKPSRHPIIAFVVGTLIALAIIAGMFALLVYQQ